MCPEWIPPTDDRLLQNFWFPTEMSVNITMPISNPEGYNLFLTDALDRVTRVLESYDDLTKGPEAKNSSFCDPNAGNHGNLVEFSNDYRGSTSNLELPV